MSILPRLTLDPKSLAAYRIALGIVMLINLIGLFPDVRSFFTDGGVLSRTDWLLVVNPKYRPSLNGLDGSAVFQYFLMGLCVLTSILVMLGYRTKASLFLTWFFLMSLQNRNPLILQGGDKLLLLMMFWGLFLPLDDAFAVRKTAASKTSDKDLAPWGLYAQFSFLYIFTALHKLSTPLWREGLGITYALHMGRFQTPWGKLLYESGIPLAWLNYAVLALQLLGPLILIFGANSWILRSLIVLAFIGLHLSFGLCLKLGLFPLVGIALMIPFIPSEAWSVFARQDTSTATNSDRNTNSSINWKVRFKNAALILCILFCFCSNLVSLFPSIQMPKPLRRFGSLLQLNQSWNMFKRPLWNDGWFVLTGRLADRTNVSINEGIQGSGWLRPESVADTYRNFRWRKYLGNLLKDRYKPLRTSFTQYVCREWNPKHEGAQRLNHVKLYYVREKVPETAESPQKGRIKNLLSSVSCN